MYNLLFCLFKCLIRLVRFLVRFLLLFNIAALSPIICHSQSHGPSNFIELLFRPHIFIHTWEIIIAPAATSQASRMTG